MNLSTTKYLILALLPLLITNYCGKSPSDPPVVQTGSLMITALIDTQPVDSMEIFLDDNYLGIHQNPCVLSGLVIGKHQVALSKDDPMDPLVDFNCNPQLVDLTTDDTTLIELSLTKLAPDFTLENLNHEERKLHDYQGKVVFLVFFSYTWSICTEAEIPTVQDSIVEQFQIADVIVFGLVRNNTPYNWLVNYTLQRGITFDMLYNADEVVELYGAFLDPTYILIGKDGRIRLRKNGFYYSSSSKELDDLILLIQQLIDEW